GRTMADRVLHLSCCAVDLSTGEVSGHRPGRLTERERTLLACLVDRDGEVVSKAELAQVFGYVERTVTRAVDKAMHGLRQKVERRPHVPEHLVTHRGEGYAFVVRPRESVEQDDGFVGRADELATLHNHVAAHRLVCLGGIGGSGKTRLAQRCSEVQAVSGRWPGGVRFVDLAASRTVEEAEAAVAHALQIECDGDLVIALARRSRTLLVLDHVERGPVADLLGSWTAQAPDLHLVVTTRVPLRLAHERLMVVGPLTDADATELYLTRARARLPGLVLAEDDHAALPELVGQLDGLPLAIELAASRVRVLRPGALVSRLADRDERFRILSRSTDGRHTSLVEVLDEGWASLTADERSALRQLATLEGEFDLAMAEAVIETSSWTVDLIEALVEGAWIRESAGRHRLLASVRAYATAPSASAYLCGLP
ncbi:MAG: winged helix-turn-helix domain-containing protein, partial [Myxococcota bacterium]